MNLLKFLKLKRFLSKNKRRIKKDYGEDYLNDLHKMSNAAAKLINEKESMGPLFTIVMSLWYQYSKLWITDGNNFLSTFSPIDLGFKTMICHLGAGFFSRPDFEQSISLSEASSAISTICSKYPDSTEPLTSDEISIMIQEAYDAFYKEDPSRAGLKIGELIVGKNAQAALFITLVLQQMVMDTDPILPKLKIYK